MLFRSNLYLSSIVALRPDTGEYVWHYQTTPGETWDFTATQHMILADLQIDGRARHVIMQAPKNGFFYVLDRETGELISAEPFAKINWAKGVDKKTGRPIENPDMRFGEVGKPAFVSPGPGGAHSWQPMSFSPKTGLVYIPVTEMTFPYFPDASFAVKQLAWNTGVDFNSGSLPQDDKIKAQIKSGLNGHLAAWDPVAQREKWRVQYPTSWNGGVLATAGDLVFQGTAMGDFVAYNADTGARLWRDLTQAGVLAPPITYQVGDQQLVAIEVGWGGAFGLAAGELARDAHIRENKGRVLAFSLDGKDALPGLVNNPPPSQQLPAETATDAVIASGKARFHRYCGTCHGDSAVSSGVIPDLRYSPALTDSASWQSIVHDGARSTRGMVAFGSELSPQDIEEIRAYVLRRAHEQK